jgi:HSP20 family protein
MAAKTQQLPSQESSSSGQLARSPQSGSSLNRGFDPFLLNPREFFNANPFSLMRRMNEEMERAFSEFSFGRGQGGSIWSPAIEVAERDGKYLVRAELAGLKPEDVKVEVTNDALVIHGERKSEQEQNDRGVHRTERHYGQFYRSIPLPEGVDAEQVRAKFENGVLEVTAPLPKTQSNHREILIETTPGVSNTETAKAAKA